jgi:hypothetical protein
VPLSRPCDNWHNPRRIRRRVLLPAAVLALPYRQGIGFRCPVHLSVEDGRTDPEVGRKRLSGRFGGHDFSHLPLDRPLVPEDFPDPDSVQAARSRTEVIINLVRRDKPTLRQLLGYLAGARGHYVTAGTPEQIADFIEDWFEDGAADGFNIMPPLLPAQLDVFSAEVIPILQRRRLFRTEYEGSRLREHYGLPWPKSVFDDPTWTAQPLKAVAGV